MEALLIAQILKVWEKHNEKMIFLLEKLPENALEKALGTKGRTVAKQFVHLHQVRCSYLEPYTKKMAWEFIKFEKDEIPVKSKILEALKQSGEFLLQLFEFSFKEKNAQVSGFKDGVVSMMSYFISHEAHHRGNILLTVKQSGIKLPEELKWKLWEDR